MRNITIFALKKKLEMANQIQGKIAQIIGPVIDVVFQEVEELPNIYDALEVVREARKV